MIPTIGYGLPTLRVVVLAAGYSTRLGQPKALAHLRGASLLRRTLSVLRPFAAASRLIVVIPPRCARYRVGFDPRRVDFIVNSRPARGLSSSVHAGVRRACCSSAILLLPVDLVELKRSDIARLISRWRGVRRRVVARRVVDQPGTPLILPRGLYRKSLGVTGERGLRDFVRLLPADAVRLVTLKSAQVDVDTRQDLDRARRRHQTLACCTSR